jgi:hypothetical protein
MNVVFPRIPAPMLCGSYQYLTHISSSALSISEGLCAMPQIKMKFSCSNLERSKSWREFLRRHATSRPEAELSRKMQQCSASPAEYTATTLNLTAVVLSFLLFVDAREAGIIHTSTMPVLRDSCT